MQVQELLIRTSAQGGCPPFAGLYHAPLEFLFSETDFQGEKKNTFLQRPSVISQALRDLPENMSRAELINSTDRAISHRSGGYLKYATADESRMGAALQGIMVAMKSPSFLTFLEVLTGIGPLLVDDTNNGGGIHQISRQGSLQIHADFNMQSPDFHRRVNAFLYLNPAWDSDAWHGDLELWDRSMTTCMQRIAPIANRLVVFSTTDFSYHGHADPLECPAHRTRRSVRPLEEVLLTEEGRPKMHSTLYQTRKCASCTQTQCRPRFDGLAPKRERPFRSVKQARLRTPVE